jgi:hypothetical protein
MGLFSGIKRELDKQQIEKNGLTTSSGWEKCDACKYRMNDPKSDYYACYVHRIRVYANQICGHFSSGSPEYEIR